MTQSKTQNPNDAGSEVLKQIGSLEAATKNLKNENKGSSDLSSDEVVNVLSIIGRAILKIFGANK